MMDYVNAFWVGGLICALVQILMEKTKMMPGRIMVLLVRFVRALSGICRSRGQRAAAGLWKRIDEGSQGGGEGAGASGTVCRRL